MGVTVVLVGLAPRIKDHVTISPSTPLRFISRTDECQTLFQVVRRHTFLLTFAQKKSSWEPSLSTETGWSASPASHSPLATLESPLLEEGTRPGHLGSPGPCTVPGLKSEG